MTILVTGGAGFVGSHIAEKYAKEGELVVILDNLSRTPFNLEYLDKNYMVIYCIKDIRNFVDVLEVIDGYEPRAIFHTAGQTAVTTSIIDPAIDFEINAIGTFNLLEAVRKSETDPKIVYCSTNKVYGKLPDDYPTKEIIRTDISPHTPYGASKLTGDLYMREYAETYGLKTGVFRMSCIYGIRQFGIEDQGWVSHFIISAIKGKTINIYGDGNQRRDLLYVTDLVDLFDRFVKSSKSGVWNAGGGPQNTMSLLELINFIEEELGRKITYKFFDERPNDQKVYISMIVKAIHDFNWYPRIKPEEGIRKLINWVGDNSAFWK